MTSYEIRTLRADERESLLALLDGWPLSDGWQGRDFFRRYLEHDSTYADENVWVAAQDGRLVACVQIFPRLVRAHGTALPVGGIGTVFTSERARGSGVSSSLLEASVDAMRARGIELSLLFASRHAFYERLGWRLWPRTRPLWLRGASARAPDPSRRIEAFDAARDLDAVAALHARYSGAIDGSVVRDRAYWVGQLAFAGNPLEDFVLARDAAGAVEAYARGCLLEGIYMITELGRAEADASAGALADLVLGLMSPRDPDPIAARASRGSAEVRRVLVAPAVADAALDAALDARGVERRAFDERSAMLRVVDAAALARRTGEARRPEDDEISWLARILPPERLCFWPSDRF